MQWSALIKCLDIWTNSLKQYIKKYMENSEENIMLISGLKGFNLRGVWLKVFILRPTITCILGKLVCQTCGLHMRGKKNLHVQIIWLKEKWQFSVIPLGWPHVVSRLWVATNLPTLVYSVEDLNFWVHEGFYFRVSSF